MLAFIFLNILYLTNFIFGVSPFIYRIGPIFLYGRCRGPDSPHQSPAAKA